MKVDSVWADARIGLVKSDPSHFQMVLTHQFQTAKGPQKVKCLVDYYLQTAQTPWDYRLDVPVTDIPSGRVGANREWGIVAMGAAPVAMPLDAYGLPDPRI